MSRNTPAIPSGLGLLSDAAVTKYLSRGMQAGQEKPPRGALAKMSVALPETEERWHVEPVRRLLDEAMNRFDGDPPLADRWLAPRLHATLRMTRAEAADSRRWNFLSMIVAPDYVVWRHRRREIAQVARFVGPHYTQAFSRLWWAAELFRSGEDYRPVEVACRIQDVLNTTMRLDVIDHRPTAAAIIQLLQRLEDSGVSGLGDRANTLSSAVNAAGSTLVYDVLAPDEPADEDALADWITAGALAPAVPWDRLPDGPDDGAVSQHAVDALLPLFERLLAEAPLRQRQRAVEEDE
ncbi:DUF6339 family protein [Crossiella cryophila]|uniref:Uncharacterized protein n=1 Tax=Crossiella cryophila TaxID=43355 RepID=A0A7W7FSZ6_9PSEU|nr:DUF6339 family protein [Crossiella cryophila]MBB4675908.1 hypothetical protein [Crossiella cryophila]